MKQFISQLVRKETISVFFLTVCLQANPVFAKKSGSDSHHRSGGHGKTTICHVPPGNPENAHSINIGNPAVLNAHLKNHAGDRIGPCPEVASSSDSSSGSGSSGGSSSSGSSGSTASSGSSGSTSSSGSSGGSSSSGSTASSGSSGGSSSSGSTASSGSAGNPGVGGAGAGAGGAAAVVFQETNFTSCDDRTGETGRQIKVNKNGSVSVSHGQCD